MKTSKNLLRPLALGLAMSLSAGLLLSTVADDSVGKGAWDLIKQSRLKTAELMQTSDARPAPDLQCPKCQTKSVTRLQKEPKGNVTRTVVVQQHLCPSCKTFTQIKGHGKAKKQVFVYECSERPAGASGCCVAQR